MYNIQDLIRAWKTRFKWEELKDKKLVNLSENVANILEDYFNDKNRVKNIKPVKIRIDEIFNVEELTLLQKEILKYLHEKEIVIETLPTSNMRIGFHRVIDTYQLFNWFK